MPKSFERPQSPEETFVAEPKEEKFSPEGELKRIKELPHKTEEEKQERQKQLEEYKEKLMEQKLGIAKMQEEFEKVIRRSAGMKPDDLRIILGAMLEQKAKEYKLEPYQQSLADQVLSTYERNHRNIEKAREKYSDDEDFFKALFGRDPKGKIEIITSPVMIYVRCYAPQDYEFIYNGKFTNQEEPEEVERVAAQMSGGVTIQTRPLIKNLKGLISAESSSRFGKDAPLQKDMFIHEEQHVIKELFNEQRLRKKSEKNLAAEKDPEKFAEALAEELRFYREDAEVHAKDEFLAYYKVGARLNDVVAKILKPKEKGGIYDYLEIHRKRLENPAPEIYGSRALIVKKIAKKVLEAEYRRVLEEAALAIHQLERFGYEKNRIIALLITEPISWWPSLVKRVAEQRNAGK